MIRYGRVKDCEGQHSSSERNCSPDRQAPDGGGQVPLRLPDGGGHGPQQQGQPVRQARQGQGGSLQRGPAGE